MRYALLTLALAIAAGCLSRSFTPTAKYVVDPQIEVSNAPKTDRSLGVRPLETARPYTVQICYLEPGYELGQYTNAEWAESPGDIVTRALMDAIRATGRFNDVGFAVNIAQPDLILTGELRRFEEIRTTQPWTAKCEVHLALRESLGPNALWSNTLTADVPLETKSLPALAAAMSKAVAQVADQAAEEIAKH